jgi:molybdopterin synthase sulfur carrier subunit
MVMTVNILTFGIAKEILGSASVGIQLNEGVTVGNLKGQLEQQYAKLKQLTSFAIAVNGAYGNADTIIKPGDEIAIIPPVSGG